MNKTLTTLSAAILGLTVATGAMAAGSKIQQSVIVNKSNVKNSANIAKGAFLGGATANQGSVQIKGSTVKQSVVVNKSNVKNSANIAIGGFLGGADANQGSIQIK